MSSANTKEKTLHCGFCKRGAEVENDCGKLWHDRTSKCTAHQKCMQYSASLAQYETKKFGGFKVKQVLKEQQRGARLKCSVCSKDKKWKKVGGATAGCAVSRCKKTYHFYCASKSKDCIAQRIEQRTEPSSKPIILYTVFCGKQHQSQFEAEKKKKNLLLSNVSDSDTDDFEEGDLSPSSSSDDDDDNKSTSPSSSSSDAADDDDDTSNSNHKTNHRPKKKDPQKKKKSKDSGGGESMEDSDSEGPVNKKKKDESQSADTKIKRPIEMNALRTKVEKLCPDNNSKNGGPVLTTAAAELKSEAASVPMQQTQSRENSADMFDSAELRASTDGSVDDREPDQDPPDRFVQRHALVVKLDRVSERAMPAVGHSPSHDDDLDETQHDQEIAVCLMEAPDEALTLEVQQKIEKCANKVFNVEADAVFIWKYSGRALTGRHVLYLLNDIAKALARNDRAMFNRLFFNLMESDLDRYDAAIDENDKSNAAIDEKERDNMVRLQITTNLKISNNRYEGGKTFSRYHLVPQLDAHVAFFLLCDATDESFFGRSRLLNSPDAVRRDISNSVDRVKLYMWDEDAEISAGQRSATTSMQRKKEESETLQRWFHENVSVGSVKRVYPRESILRRINDSTSVAAKLAADHPEWTLSAGESQVVFIIPGELVVHAEYAKRRIASAVKTVSIAHDLFVVLDIFDKHGKACTLGDLVPADLEGSIKFDVQVALNPKCETASCVLLHFYID